MIPIQLSGLQAEPPSRDVTVLPHLAHAVVLSRHLQAPLSAGNRVSPLIDGPQTYQAMFDAIDSARDHINLDSCIVDAGGAGRELAERLAARRRQGVRVNLLLNQPVNSRRLSPALTALRRAGALLCEPSWTQRLSSFARMPRSERTLMVVDGRRGVVGGVHACDIAARTLRGREHAAGWRNTHLAVEGPAVAALQRLFVQQWRRTTSVALPAGEYFPAPSPAGSQRVGVAANAGSRSHDSFHAALVGAIQAAEHRIYLSTAHFAPTWPLLRSLVHAARRGVDVHMLLPGSPDGDDGGCWSTGPLHYGALLRAGVHLHERQDGVLHAKTSIIDGVWTSFGASTLDWRRCAREAEPALVVLDGGFGHEMEQLFAHDLAHCREMRVV